METHLKPFHRDILKCISMNPKKPPLILKDKQTEGVGARCTTKEVKASWQLANTQVLCKSFSFASFYFPQTWLVSSEVAWRYVYLWGDLRQRRKPSKKMVQQIESSPSRPHQSPTAPSRNERNLLWLKPRGWAEISIASLFSNVIKWIGD